MMRELLQPIQRWHRDGKRTALATVVKAWGSSPRPLGSKMVISSEGQMAGSVSGGCVEAAVVEEALKVLEEEAPRLVAYGVSDETAWSVGLSCGGAIEVFIAPLLATSAGFAQLSECLETEKLTVTATVLDGPDIGRQLLLAPDENASIGTLGQTELDHAVAKFAAELVAERRCARHRFGSGEESREVFVDLHLPPAKLVVVGAVHVAIHLVAFAKRLGFHTLVIDPRTAFATPERFAEADELIASWPSEALAEIPIHQSTCFAFLSHDPKIDLPGLEIALTSSALYVGALGSRSTNAKRVAALRERGLPQTAIARLKAPIGLDLGGRRAEEIALAVIAEIVAAQHGKEGRST